MAEKTIKEQGFRMVGHDAAEPLLLLSAGELCRARFSSPSSWKAHHFLRAFWFLFTAAHTRHDVLFNSHRQTGRITDIPRRSWGRITFGKNQRSGRRVSPGSPIPHAAQSYSYRSRIPQDPDLMHPSDEHGDGNPQLFKSSISCISSHTQILCPSVLKVPVFLKFPSLLGFLSLATISCRIRALSRDQIHQENKENAIGSQPSSRCRRWGRRPE